MKYGDLKIMAAKAGIKAQYLWKVRVGEKTPSPNLARRLEKATGYPAESFVFPEKYPDNTLMDRAREKVLQELKRLGLAA